MIRKISISFLFIIGIIIAVVLEKEINGKHFATLILTILFMLYWFCEFLYSYILFRKEYAEKYKIYKVKLINESSDLTLEKINNNNKFYYKKFKRTQLKESCIQIAELSGILGLIVSLIVFTII